jgi:hypothetical protein
MARGSNRLRVGTVLVAVMALALTSCDLLASPNNFWGNNLPDGCTSLTSTTGACAGSMQPQPGMWAAIQGPFSRHQDGDPYATMCSSDTTLVSTCDPNAPTGGPPLTAATGVQNTTYEPNGYSWAVDVPSAGVGVPITVQVYDPAMGPTGAPLSETMDSTAGPFTTSYELFQTTGQTDALSVKETPDLSMNGHCTTGPGYQTFTNGISTGAPYYTEHWFTLCTFTPTTPGIYPLQVKTSDIPGVQDAGGGWNAYSVRAVADSGPQPEVYPMSNVSLWMDAVGTTARFYLTNVGSQNAGKTMLVNAFDPGDGTGPDAFTVQVLAPPSGLTPVPSGGSPVACNYNAIPSPTISPATPDASANCTIVTKNAGSSTGVYNGGWLAIRIPIPASYTCTIDCWWSVKVGLGTGASTPSDRATWTVLDY